MPTLTSRGAASARGFGLLGAAPLNSQTATFTSSGSWTAPAGVTNLTVLTGAGGTGTPFSSEWINDSSLGYAAYSYESDNTTGVVNGAPTYAEIATYGDSVLASINSSTADRTVSWTEYRYFYNPSNQKTLTLTGTTTSRVRGVVVKTFGAWDNTSSQPVLGLGNGWYFGGEQYYEQAATTGGNSSAFGNTYAGGVGGAATPVTTNNVTVIPGQTYTITVASGGYVTFQYIS